MAVLAARCFAHDPLVLRFIHKTLENITADRSSYQALDDAAVCIAQRATLHVCRRNDRVNIDRYERCVIARTCEHTAHCVMLRAQTKTQLNDEFAICAMNDIPAQGRLSQRSTVHRLNDRIDIQDAIRQQVAGSFTQERLRAERRATKLRQQFPNIKQTNNNRNRLSINRLGFDA